MRIRAAIMTLLNVTAMADGKVTEDEKKMIFNVLKNKFHYTEKELELGFKKNTKQLKENTLSMIHEAVLIMREECSTTQIKHVIKLLKDLSLVDNNLDRREMMIIELLEQLTEEK